MRRVRVTIVVVDKQKVSLILSVCFSLMYPACNRLFSEPYYNAVYGLFGFAFFFSTHKRPDLLKMCIYSLQYLSEKFLILRIIRRDITIHAHRS